MKVSQLLEYGRIVLGVNTTKDVSPNEIPKQARKWGFKVDKDGRPPTLSKKVKGKSTNVLFNLGLAESIQKIDFKDPNFEQEWDEAQRYSEFKKIGKDAWIDLAKQGDKVDIDNALSNKINNTEAGEKNRDSFKNLEKDKQERFVKDLASNNIELPIIARYSDDHLELIGGNTRLTGMMKHLGQGKAWIFDVPDEIANLAEATVDEIAKSSEIYVDMDGVLADFFGDWKKLVGKDWRKITDIGPALQKIRDTDDFWLKLPMTSNAKNLLNLIKNIKGSYKILSSPLPDDPNSEPHKREWIESNLNFFPPEDVIITFDKAKFATQSDGTPNILIDDYGVNIQKWESAGGVGFKHKDHKFERTARNIQAHMTQPVKEKWSAKYKKSINCSNPKGFSQKAHCAGRKKRNENYERSQLPQIKSHDLQYVDHEFIILPIDKVVPVQKERVMENFKRQVDRIVIGQYTPIVVDCENRIVNGHHRYDAVKLLGEKYIQVAKIPHSIECLIENFADGKKKGRKGLAKRSGVNCKQSISKLRKIAKNSTGERRRMAHWCANMKSGRKK